MRVRVEAKMEQKRRTDVTQSSHGIEVEESDEVEEEKKGELTIQQEKVCQVRQAARDV